jgi:flagellar motility protein MotE (MotC chaperone)
MNFFKSRWFPVLLAVVLSLGTSGYLIMFQWTSLFTDLPKIAFEAPPLLWSFKDTDIEKYISELRDERKKFESREADLEKTAAQVAAQRAELIKVQNDIKASREQFNAAIADIQEGELKNLRSLANTYANMAPPAAVNILAQMDETMVVKILALMKTDKVAGIFQEMGNSRNPDSDMAKRAARLSDRLRLVKERKDSQKP